MRPLTDLPELLAPAGSPEALYAAVRAGADAVYLGAKSFGARAFAKNFEEDELANAVRYCHLHGVRLYVTVNTLVFDRELDECVELCRRLYTLGVDALIVADLGLVRRLRAELPEMPLHASTQMSVHNAAGVRAAASMGLSRVVVARELSRENIRTALTEGGAEIEVFVHGALCVCHSGQCLFSSLVGGRSGNRGTCAQPCRLPYGGRDRYPLSLRDLSLAAHVPALIELGVHSLKIEGRMKSPSYVYGVTRVYRRLLDERRAATADEQTTLAALFSRGGFTDKYFTAEHTDPMTGVRTEADKDATRGAEEPTFTPTPVRATATAVFRRAAPCELTLSAAGRTVTVTGEIPCAAQNAPLTRDALTSRLCKMGGTYLSLEPQDVEVTVDDGLFLPPAAVNELRRRAVAALTDEGREAPHRMPPDSLPPPPFEGWTALFHDSLALRRLDAEHRAAFRLTFVPLGDYAPGDGAGVYLPPVVTDTEWADFLHALSRAKELGATHALVENLGQIGAVRAAGLIPVGDLRLNVTNRASAAAYAALGVQHLLPSAELTLPMIRDLMGAATVYGRLPLMITERCFVREGGGCAACGHAALVDRRGKRFPMLREHAHRTLIVNSVPTYMADRAAELRRAGVVHEQFIFTVESAREIAALIDAYRAGRPPTGEVRRI